MSSAGGGEGQMQVYKAGVEALESMPLHEMCKRLEVNSYEGVTLESVLLRYGCDAALRLRRRRAFRSGVDPE